MRPTKTPQNWNTRRLWKCKTQQSIITAKHAEALEGKHSMGTLSCESVVKQRAYSKRHKTAQEN